MGPDDRSDRVGVLPIPEALFVLGHDESGRPRYHQTILETVVAAGLFAELAIEGALTVTDGRPVWLHEPDRPRDVTEWLRRLLSAAAEHDLGSWLVEVGAEVTRRTYEGLERSGTCVRESSRRLRMFTVVRLRFAEPTLPGRIEAWYNSALVWTERPDRADAALAMLARQLGDRPPAYTDLPEARRQERKRLLRNTMDEPLHRIVAASRQTITAAALGTYR